MEILAVLNNGGVIVPVTTTPAVLDLSQYIGSYVHLATLTDTDQLFICPLPTSSAPTVYIADTTGETGHTTSTVSNVAALIAGGAVGKSYAVKSTHPYLWVRSVTGSFDVYIKPSGRLGEGL